MPYCSRCHEAEVPKESDMCPVCMDEIISDGLEDNTPFDEAEKIMADPGYVSKTLKLGALVPLLRDKDAAAILRQLLKDRNPGIVNALMRHDRIDKKRGRKPLGPQALYLIVYNLRKSGLTFGQIALRIWNDHSKDRQARAHYNYAVKQGHPKIKSPAAKK